MTLEHEEVREKLIATALGLMETGGIEAVKARALSQATGVSVGTVYNLFGNVDGVIETACARLFERLGALGMAHIDVIEHDFAAQVAAGTLAGTAKLHLRHALLSLAFLYIRFVTENAQSWGALLAFNRSRPNSAFSDWYRSMPEEMIGILARMLGDAPGMADEAQRMTVGWALWSSIHGIVTLSYVGQSGPDALARTRAQIEALISLVVDGIFAV